MKIKLLRMLPDTDIVLSTTTKIMKGDPKEIIFDTCRELLLKYKKEIFIEYYSDVTVDMFGLLKNVVSDYLPNIWIMIYTEEGYWLEEYSVHRLWIK